MPITSRSVPALGEGGVGLVGVLLLISIVDEFPRTAATVLAPNIQQSLGISDTVLLGMLGLVGVALVLSTLPAAALGDRIKRTHVVAAGTLVLAACCVFVGASPQRIPDGARPHRDGHRRRQSACPTRRRCWPTDTHSRPAPGSSRSRAPVGRSARSSARVFAGLVAGAIAGPDDWRWVFVILAVPIGLLGIAALFLRNPPRGQYEQKEVLGEVLEAEEGIAPITLSAAFARLKKVRSFYFVAVGIGVLGFALVSVPSLISLMLEEQYGYSASERGLDARRSRGRAP